MEIKEIIINIIKISLVLGLAGYIVFLGYGLALLAIINI